MVKKLSLLMAAVAVLAFSIPAVADAVPTYTSPALTSIPKPAEIRMTAVGGATITSPTLGPIECKEQTINAELVTNSGGTVTLKSSGGFTASSCTDKGNPVTITSFTLNDLVSTVSGKGTMSFTTVVDVAGLTCTYTGTSIPYTYTLESSEITFSKAGTVDGSPAGCGNATLDATWTYEVSPAPNVWKHIFQD